MTRKQAECIIDQHFGLQPEGQQLLLDLIADMGFQALTDYAVTVLAGKHLEFSAKLRKPKEM